MTRSLLLSVHPVFAKAILSGQKTVEIRRVRPDVAPGSLAFLYASAPMKALLGVFEVDRIVTKPVSSLWRLVSGQALITKSEYDRYVAGVSHAHAILIANSWNLLEPLSLDQIRAIWPGFRPPQSFRYLATADAKATTLSRAVHRMLPKNLGISQKRPLATSRCEHQYEPPE